MQLELPCPVPGRLLTRNGFLKVGRSKVYIALSISGAYQHQAGMKNADTIIAVNKDPMAPIFGIAHYGIVDDLLQVLPLLTEKFAKK